MGRGRLCCSRGGRRGAAGRARLLRSLRATVALKAGRGAKARRARPRAERRRLALDWGLDSGVEASSQREQGTRPAWQRRGLVVASSHARGRTRRASPGTVRRVLAGGWHAACAIGGMTRSDNKPLFRSFSEGRAALLDARGRQMRFALTPSEQLLWSRLWAQARRRHFSGSAFRRGKNPRTNRMIFDAPTRRLGLPDSAHDPLDLPGSQGVRPPDPAPPKTVLFRFLTEPGEPSKRL